MTDNDDVIADFEERISRLEHDYSEKKEQWAKERYDLAKEASRLQHLLAECYRALYPGVKEEDFKLAEFALPSVKAFRKSYDISLKKLTIFMEHQIIVEGKLETIERDEYLREFAASQIEKEMRRRA